MVGLLDAADHDLYGTEQFGPVASSSPPTTGGPRWTRRPPTPARSAAITAFVYSVEPTFLERAEELYAVSGAALSLNLTGRCR